MKALNIILVTLFFSVNLFSQTWQWAQAGGGAGDDQGHSIRTDINGNSYVTGSFNSTAIFGTHALTSYGNTDMFIAKYSPSGNCIWAQHAGGTNIDSGNAIAIDSSGNCYVAGTFIGLAIFGNTNVGNYSGSENVFLAKYNSNGQLLWVKCNSDNVNGIYCNSLAVDAVGNAWITGYSNGGTHIFGSHTFTGIVGYIIRYDSSGNINYVTTTNDFIAFRDIDVDTVGNVYACGGVSIVKLDPDGNQLWMVQGHQTIPSGFGCEAQTLCYDHHGHIYIGCSFDANISFGTDSLLINQDSVFTREIGLLKFDLDGNEIWARESVHDSIGNNFVTSIVCDASGENIYLTGSFDNDLHFGNISLPASNRGTFLTGYNASGVVYFAIGAGYSNSIGIDISTDALGGIYITGTQYDAAIFGNYTTAALGDEDVFVSKIFDPLQSIIAENNSSLFILFSATDEFHLIAKNYIMITNHPELIMYDISGRIIKEIPITDSEMIIGKSELSPGIYLWRVKNDQEQLASGKISTF